MNSTYLLAAVDVVAVLLLEPAITDEPTLVERLELLLDTRVDRKYVITTDDLDAVLTGIPGLRVLEIDGRRSSRYESTYLDTVDLDGWSSSAHQHRRRWKVHTRRYAQVHDVDPADLVATLHTSYLRTTLLLDAGAGRATVDRGLWELGHRPIRIAKYGTGLALLTPDLQHNRWHRVTSRHLAGHVTVHDGVLG